MTDLRSAEADLKHALNRIESRTRFAEVMAERKTGEGFMMESKSTTPTIEPRLQGAVFRAWGGARWVEVATSSLDAASLGIAIGSIEVELSRVTGQSPPPGESSTTVGEWSTETAHPMRALGAEEMVKLGREIRTWATAVPGIKDTRVAIAWEENERLYLNTAGARCFQNLKLVRGSVAPMAIENGKVEFDYLSEGGLGGRERLDFLTEEKVTEVARDARALLHAKSAPTGMMNVLLDPGVAGLFAHESFGHGTEADQFVRDRSYLKPLLGQMVGPEYLTLVDNGAHPTGWGSIYYDDEGHPAQRTELIKDGRFVGALHDRETAAVLHARPTGNTRRADFLSRAFVRMTNTYVEPQDWAFEELVAEAKDGVILEHGTSGIEDPQGGQMQFKVKKGHRIEHGKVTELVSSMALSGSVLEFLKSIRGIGDKKGFEISPGYCGKGHTDLLTSGTGGAYLLSRAIVGPA
jgi:TldD protein